MVGKLGTFSTTDYLSNYRHIWHIFNDKPKTNEFCSFQVLKAERPDVDKKRSDLLKLQGEFALKLRHLEKSLLEALNNAKGKILDDNRFGEIFFYDNAFGEKICRKVLLYYRIILPFSLYYFSHLFSV